MRYFIFFLLFFTLGFSAKVDTKLFDPEENSEYFIKISKDIEKSSKNSEKPQEIIEEERKNLKILEEINAKVVKINRFEEIPIENLKDVTQALNFLIQLEKKESQIKEFIKTLQDKLSYSKKKIENIIEAEKNRLLIYQLQFAYYKIEKIKVEKKITLYKKN